MRYESYAQEYEDIILYAMLGNTIKHGFYIDVGAYDPVDISVTKFFYDRGWNGVNIEPLTSNYSKFQETRLRDINLCVGVSDFEDCQKKSLPIYEAGGCSTFVPHVAEKLGDFSLKSKPMVEMMTLDEIYHSYIHSPQEIHFCKIDVEGYEKKVLNGIKDWNEFRPWIYVMESTEPQTLIPSYMDWESILTENGYICSYYFGVNRYYVDSKKEEIIERASQVDDFFYENEIVRMRMFSRSSKVLREKLAIVGLGHEFEENKNRILTRSRVVACFDNYQVPKKPFWRNLYKEASFIENCGADKILVCTHKYYDEIKEDLVSRGIASEKIVGIEYLRFDRL